MKFELPPLPYATDALEPYIGAETVSLHYEKHHRGYLEKLRRSIEGTLDAEESLETLIQTTAGDDFNNAAQVWNHDFYWKSLRPDGGGEPKDASLLRAIESSFGSTAGFRKAFADTANLAFKYATAPSRRRPTPEEPD